MEHEIATNLSRDSYVLALAKTGATYEDIGTQIGISRERVRQILQAHGISRKSSITETHQRIRALAAESRTVEEIATAVDKPLDYVDHFCRQNRLHVPRRRKLTPDGSQRIREKPALIVNRVREYVSLGKTTAEIASALNQPYHTIYSLRRRNSI